MSLERIGVSPSDVSQKDSHLAGDRVQKESVWRVFSPQPRGEERVDSHIEALLKLLKPHTVKVRAISKDYSIGINCVGYYFSSNPELHLSKDIIRGLEELGVEVDFDLYNYCAKCKHEVSIQST